MRLEMGQEDEMQVAINRIRMDVYVFIEKSKIKSTITINRMVEGVFRPVFMLALCAYCARFYLAKRLNEKCHDILYAFDVSPFVLHSFVYISLLQSVLPSLMYLSSSSSLTNGLFYNNKKIGAQHCSNCTFFP